MAESSRGTGSANKIQLTAGAAISAAEIWQLADGRCARKEGGGASSGSLATFNAVDPWVVPKTTGVVILDGGRVYWDHSANSATYRKTNDRDFYMGRAVGNAASADDEMTVNFNVPEDLYDYDLARDPFTTAIVGTQALGGLELLRRGGAHHIVISATNEAQKIDMLSVDGFAPGAKAIVEGAFRVISDGAGTVVDVSIGIANATHATDADSITESMFVHLDANNVNINLESDDGTTEVAATDTTIDYTESPLNTNRVEFWFDLGDSSDIQAYINGANVLPASVFKLNAATGPLKLLVHVEKTASTDTYEIVIDFLRVRLAQQ